MEKELVTIEFRYHDAPKKSSGTDWKTETITVGVFDSFDEAIIEGNKALEVFEKHFKIHKFPNGNEAKKDRFGKNNGPFGSCTRLVSELAYLSTPFQFFIKVTTLKHKDIEQTILEVLDARKRYVQHQKDESSND